MPSAGGQSPTASGTMGPSGASPCQGSGKQSSRTRWGNEASIGPSSRWMTHPSISSGPWAQGSTIADAYSSTLEMPAQRGHLATPESSSGSRGTHGSPCPGQSRRGNPVGERGIERPIYAPKDSMMQFQWPVGIPPRARRQILRAAWKATPPGPRWGSRVVRWLQSNAWRCGSR